MWELRKNWWLIAKDLVAGEFNKAGAIEALDDFEKDFNDIAARLGRKIDSVRKAIQSDMFNNPDEMVKVLRSASPLLTGESFKRAVDRYTHDLDVMEKMVKGA